MPAHRYAAANTYDSPMVEVEERGAKVRLLNCSRLDAMDMFDLLMQMDAQADSGMILAHVKL